MKQNNVKTDRKSKPKKNTEEMKLSNNLLPRQEELEKELSFFEIGEEDVNLDRVRADFEQLNDTMTKSAAEYERIDGKLVETTNRLEELKIKIEKLKEKESQESRKLQNESKSMEKLLNNRGLLISKREEIQRKIRDIGSLPAKSQKKFQNAQLGTCH